VMNARRFIVPPRLLTPEMPILAYSHYR